MNKERVPGFSSQVVAIETVTIASGQTTSSTVVAGGLLPVAILFPSAMTGTSVTFTRCDDGSTYSVVNGVSMTFTASKWVPLTDAWEAMQLGDKFKIVSSTTEGSERTLKVALRGI